MDGGRDIIPYTMKEISSNGTELSVVLPTYNERENLAVLIPEVEKAFGHLVLEIIVVDDGSMDGTKELLSELNVTFGNIKPIYRKSLGGIGSALRDGYNNASGEFILSSDADMSFPVGDMVKLYQKIKEGYDFVTGYRHGGEGYYEKRTASVKIKYIISRFGNVVVRKLSGIKVRDFSANFRVIRRVKWLELKTKENTNSLLFEMIVKATQKGFLITEIPVHFHERRFGTSKLNLWKEAPKFLIKALKYVFFK